jgi:2-polyprenyl-6-methoxyphenol hydroxylase-like FAD-dependent oxidoreductase
VLRQITVPLGSSHLRTWRGEVLVDLPLQEAMQRSGARTLAVHRAELQAALEQALEPGCLHTNKRAVGFEQDKEGVRVRFAQGEAMQADVLVGADGLHSVIRTQLVGAARPRYAGYTAWRGVTSFPLGQRDAQTTFETWGAGKRFGMIPLTRGRICWFAVANAPEGARVEEPEQEKQKVLELVSSCHAPAQAVIAATKASAILRTDLYDRPPLSSWSQGRVTLVGDAAHPMTPNLGQGACQAIEDALMLAACLSSEPTIHAALRRYEALRMRRANTIVRRSWQQGRIAQWEQPLLVNTRDRLLRLIPPHLLLKQLAWIVDQNQSNE